MDNWVWSGLVQSGNFIFESGERLLSFCNRALSLDNFKGYEKRLKGAPEWLPSNSRRVVVWGLQMKTWTLIDCVRLCFGLMTLGIVAVFWLCVRDCQALICCSVWSKAIFQQDMATPIYWLGFLFYGAQWWRYGQGKWGNGPWVKHIQFWWLLILRWM